jgi:hypothetical protein
MFPPTVDLKVEGGYGPLNIASGASFNLSWTTTMTSAAYGGSWSLSDGMNATPVADVNNPAYQVVGLTATKTFTLSCINASGVEAHQSVTANVTPIAAIPTSHLLFVSSQTYTGNLGGLSGADSICNTLASNAASTLGTTYAARPFKALIGVAGSTIQSRLQKFGPVYNNKPGTRDEVKSGIDAMFTSGAVIDKVIVYSEQGNAVVDTGSNDEDTWTGASSNRTGSVDSGNNCNDWTTSSSGEDGNVGSGGQGTSSNNPGEWLYDDSTSRSCSHSRHIYCISQ